MDLLDIGLSVVDWIGLVQDRYRWRAFVNTVMNLRVPYNAGKLPRGCTTCGLSSGTQLHRVSYFSSSSSSYSPRLVFPFLLLFFLLLLHLLLLFCLHYHFYLVYASLMDILLIFLLLTTTIVVALQPFVGL
jgi:hypothetical protein